MTTKTVCEFCEEKTAGFKVILVDMDGTLIDSATVCKECLPGVGCTVFRCPGSAPAVEQRGK